MKQCPTCNDYKLLQQNHQVYCDEPGPDCDGKPFTDYVDENTFKHKLTQQDMYNKTNLAIEMKYLTFLESEFNKTKTQPVVPSQAPAEHQGQALNKTSKKSSVFNKTASDAYDKSLFNKYAAERELARKNLTKVNNEKIENLTKVINEKIENKKKVQDLKQFVNKEEDKAAQEQAKKLIKDAEIKAVAVKA